MKKYFYLFLILIGALTLNAQAATLYLTETDSDGVVYIINTDTGTFLTADVSPQESPGAIAVLGDRVVMANYTDDGSWEYDLALNPTGNSWPGSNGLWDQMLDGTTDGVNNYVASWSDNGVVEMDLQFENGAVLFNPGFSVIGITYDPTDDSLWLVNDDDTSIHQYSKAGVSLGSLDADLGGRNCCLAYDPGTDTLWMSQNGGSTMYQFEKDGTALDSVNVVGLPASNTWGAEIGGDFPVAAAAAPVPAMSRSSVLALVLVLLVFGGLMVRLYTH